MSSLTTKEANYLNEYLPKLKSLAQPNEQQKLILVLSEKIETGKASNQDTKALKLLLKAQQATEKAQQAKHAVKAVLNQQQLENRKTETRKKILIGSLIMHNIEVQKGGYTIEKLISALDEFLTREQDRKLFGLGAKNADY